MPPEKIETVMTTIAGTLSRFILLPVVPLAVVLWSTDAHAENPSAKQTVEHETANFIERRATAVLTLKQEPRGQILFGDLHVHTSFSPDGFIMSMPLQGGDGLHPPYDACQFARYCSAVDFWSINDHAEGLTPQRWDATKRAIRECNAESGDPDNPDMVSFLGWEWTQIDSAPTNYYGHKNVIFLDTEEDRVPARAIAAPRQLLAKAPIGKFTQWAMGMLDFPNRAFYFSISDYYEKTASVPVCPKGVDTRELPKDCMENAATPAELFEKLSQWGFDNMVVPHGSMNVPPNASFDMQLNTQQHNPDNQLLFEVYSGHGNSEEFFRGKSVGIDANGNKYCPTATDEFLPCCQRAGTIIRERCVEAGLAADECDRRAQDAQQNYVEAGVSGHLTVPGQKVTDWLNCGQCESCFSPTMNLRPGTTTQYALAISNFDNVENPLRYRFGMIGSSDNHSGRAGNGFKEFARFANTETRGLQKDIPYVPSFEDTREPIPESIKLSSMAEVNLGKLRNTERKSSFYVTGGLVAVHAEGRSRHDIWNSLRQREVYGTSGDRILLWFDMIMPDGSIKPMGSEVRTNQTPTFRVSALGALEQLPGCPASAVDALGKGRIQSLCRGECFNPGNNRKVIERIEVIKIRPQAYAGEDVSVLIEDPWRTIECPASEDGCTIEFSDDTFVDSQRDALYYVRALQSPSLAVNGGGLRCEYDEQGQCIAVDPCYGDFRTDPADDCLSPVQERAWSSPIFVDVAKPH